MTTRIITTIPADKIHIPEELGELRVKYKGREFFVKPQNGVKTCVARADLSRELRGIPSETLHKMLEVGYLTVNKIGEDYAIRFHGRIAGGGLGFAIATYVSTTLVGGAMVVAGAVTAPLGVGVGLAAAGATVIAAAPYTFMATLPAPTP